MQCYYKQYCAYKDIRNFTNITKILEYICEKGVILLTEQDTVHKEAEA